MALTREVRMAHCCCGIATDTSAGMETTAEEVDGGYVVNGSKTWITNAPVA